MEYNTSEASHFSQYGKAFQEKVFQGLLSDHDWARQMIEVMNSSFFELKYLQFLTEKYFKYHEKYKSFPTLGLLITIVKDELSKDDDIVLREQIVSFLYRLKTEPDLGDQLYVKDKALNFCKTQAFKDALAQAIELISTERFEDVVGLMKTAVAVGMPHSTGHDFFEDAQARFVKINRNACPTGISKLDEKGVLNGGLGRGELGVVVANTGVGKSHWLVAVGAHAMKMGKNVLHYTLELTEHAVGLRYDSNLCKIPSNEVQDRKKEVLQKYEDDQLGRLIIKEYPTGGATVLTVRNHIEKLALKGFVPNVIIIDYADIMRSSRTYDSLRLELKLIYEELRNLAMDLNLPVWTASQANRESANSDIVGLENMSEAYAKAMVADVVISLSRKATEKATGHGRLFVAKNRAGKDGIVFPLEIDTAISNFTVLDESTLTLLEATQSDHAEMKQLLKEKWKEVRDAV